MSVAGEVGEQELALSAGQVPVEALAVPLHDERAAQVDPERRGGGHANIVEHRPGPGREEGCDGKGHQVRVRVCRSGR